MRVILKTLIPLFAAGILLFTGCSVSPAPTPTSPVITTTTVETPTPTPVDNPPQITGYYIPPDITAGQEFQVSANATDDYGVNDVYLVLKNGEEVRVRLDKINGEYKGRLKVSNPGKYSASIVASDTQNQETSVGKDITVINPVKEYAKSVKLSDEMISRIEPLGIGGMDENEKTLVNELLTLPSATYSDSRLRELLYKVSDERTVSVDQIKLLKSYFDTSKYLQISLFYDLNLNGVKDSNEVLLTNLDLDMNSDIYHIISQNGSVLVPPDMIVKLYVSGKAPNGKTLINATFNEPESVVLLTDGIPCKMKKVPILVGVADGYMTSPIKPSEMSSRYNMWLSNQSYVQELVNKYYSQPWKYTFNYFFYGCRILEGGFKGQPHLAFDIFADTGTEVHAPFGGEIVKGIYDIPFGIRGPSDSISYYTHINPSVKIGDKVKRYDVVGRIDSSGLNHVHFEFRPDPTQILKLFPGVKDGTMLTSPSKGEKVFILPYFR